MTAVELLSFQADQDKRFQELEHEPIDEAEAARLAEACDVEWAAVQAMRDQPAGSLAEITARVAVLVGLIDQDRYDETVWIDLARQIAIDQSALTRA